MLPGNNRDLSVKTTQLMLRAYVLTLSKVFATLKFIQMLVKRLCLYSGQGCVDLRTACVFMEVDKENITLPGRNHSNFSNIVRIVGCDFLYLAPVLSHQLIKYVSEVCKE